MESINTITVPQMNANLSSLDESELRRLLVEWNDTAVGYPAGACIHHLFEAQALQRPDAVALAFRDERVTYGDLNRRANQLAHLLRSLGVGPEVLVGILIDRSVEMVVGLLATLKAGGAYVPLDPGYPAERLRFMLEDAAVKVLLTQEHLIGTLAPSCADVLCLGSDWRVLEGESEENLDSGVAPMNLAYVIYTSGSTGTPKGVEIQHAGLVNLAIWHQRAYEVTPADRATLLAALGFDASVWEIWPYLTAGASLYFPDDETRRTPARLVEWLAAEGITLSFMPTPLGEAVLAEQWPVEAALRVLLVGGDKLHRRPRSATPFALVNHYGPTENSVVTTCYEVSAVQGSDGPPPIGRPIANTLAYILDDRQKPVPVGTPGELYVGGVGLARGYHNRPELTAERFIANPFSDDPHPRLYRTGDLVRYLPDGNIEFLGRIDQQVKIRGFRIELGEIESVLATHPLVRDTAVIAREDMPGEKRLVAYIVSSTGQTAPAHELRQYLKEKLPEYMIPSVFVWVESMPLTPNGKLNRGALPPPTATTVPLTGRPFLRARTEMERAVAEVWKEVIHVEQIGMDENLFDLGVHSLQMVQALQKLEASLHADFSITKMFQYPTVGSLAKYLSQELGEQPLAGKIQERAQKQKEALARRKQLVRGE